MAEESSYRRRLPAGIVDSAFASLATFVTGLAAVNLLDDVNRGVYAVFFSAFVAGGVLTHNLVFLPASVKAVSYGPGRQLASFSQGLRLGIGPGILGSTTALAALWATSGYADRDVAVAFTITLAITIVLSPMQDHARRMLHIAALSWRAATVSIVQLVVVVAAVAIALAIDLPVQWIPFGALGLANAFSLGTGWVLGYLAARHHELDRLTLGELAKGGKWLVGSAAVAAATTFAVSAIVAQLADPETLGYAESARVVAQPIIVLAFGLSAVLAPRSMRAAMESDKGIARHTSWAFFGLLSAGAVVYAAIAGWDWQLNPMAYIVPSAYVVQGLVVVTVLANVSAAVVLLQENELLGARRERALMVISFIASPIQLLGSLTAGVTGAFARPMASIMNTSTRWFLQRRTMRRVYHDGHPATENAASEPGA